MKQLLIALVFIASVACSTQLYIPTEVNVNKVEPATLTELQQGHDLYQNKCGKCHKLPKPASHTNPEWTKVLQVMAPKAKLNTEQSELIYKYLVNR